MSESSYECLSDPETVDIEYPSSDASSEIDDSESSNPGERNDSSAFSFLSDDVSGQLLSGESSAVCSPVRTELAQGVEDLHLEGQSPDLISVVDGVMDGMKTVKDFIAKKSSTNASDETEVVRRLIEDVELLQTGIKKLAAKNDEGNEKIEREAEKNLKRLSQSSLADEEIKRLRKDLGATTLSPSIKSSLEGNWQLTSSKCLKLFLVKMRQSGMDILEEILFEKAQPHFSFDGDILTMYQEYRNCKFYSSTSTLGKPTEVYGYTRVSFLEDEKLHTVDKKTSTGMIMNKEERFIENGKLHIVVQRFGTECTRIYERI